ncbi:MAG: MFS transporter [Candidatus Heimdallarchaeota archaeon]|nr:MFS transporter [Candidatus Heimdallarchaeota archaeon]
MDQFLGIGGLPERTRGLVKLFFYMFMFIMSVEGMGTTFVILHYVQIFGFADAAVLMSIVFGVLFLTDYPSGSLGDYIGQRVVLTIALLSFGVGYTIISQFESFLSFAVASVFFGLALGQLSGALETWLDNNYKKTVNDSDPDNKIYGFAMARITTLTNFTFAISFVIGGVISSLISRQFLFLLVAILIILIIPIIIKYVKDIDDSDIILEDINISESKNFFVYLKGGFKHLFSSKKSFTLLMGFAIIDSISSLWFVLILFPLYFGYTGSDVGVGILRSFVWIIGGFLIIYAATLSKRVSNNRIGILYFVVKVGLYLGVIAIIDFIPLNDSFQLQGIILLVLLLVSNQFFGTIALTIRKRILLETTPSEFRNSIYSLISTIATLVQLSVMIYVGKIIELESLSSGLWIMIIVSLIGIGLLFIHDYFSETKLEKMQQPVPIEFG